MKVLITGAGGYLGRRLVEIAAGAKDIHVTALIRKGSDTRHLENTANRIVFADLAQQNTLSELPHDVDCIYHLAAATSGSHFEMMMNTVVATENLLNALKGSRVKRFVLVSSFSVYQMSSLKRGALLDETCPIENQLNKRDPYTITKVRQENLVQRKCRELNLPLVIIRPGKIYGPGDHPVPPQLGLTIPDICFLYIGGKNIIPLTHVTNCAHAIFHAGVTEAIDGEIFNIVDDNLPTQKEFLKAYESILGKIRRKIWLPSPLFTLFAIFFEIVSRKTKGNIPPIITRYRCVNLFGKFKYNNDKAKKMLHWNPDISVCDGVDDMLKNHKTV